MQINAPLLNLDTFHEKKKQNKNKRQKHFLEAFFYMNTNDIVWVMTK